jgi:uncharacterized membrane protein YfhO
MAKRKRTVKSSKSGIKKSEKKQLDRTGYSAPFLKRWFDQFVYPKANWVAIAAVAFVGLLIFHDFLFGKYLYLFKDIGSDTVNLIYPAIACNAEILHEYGLVHWNFHKGMGNPTFFMGLANPFGWIPYLIGKEHFAYSIIWMGYLQILFAGFFFYKYLRTLELTDFSCILGSVLFAYSGYIVGVHSWWSFNNLFLGAALLLWGSELLLKKNNWIILPLALYFLSSSRLITFALFLGIYTLFRYIMEKGWDWKGLLIYWLKLGLSSGLGVMMSLWYFGARMKAFFESPRISGEAAQTSNLLDIPVFIFQDAIVNITAVLRLFSNEILGSGAQFSGFHNYLEAPFYYVGLITLLLIPQIFVVAKGRTKYLYGGLLLLWIVFATFPFFRRAFFLFVVDQFRVFSFLASLVLLFIGINALSRIDNGRKINIPLLGVTLAVLLLLLNYPYDADIKVASDIRIFANVALVLNALLLFLLSRHRFKYLASALILICALVELAYFGYQGAHKRDIVSSKEYNSRIAYNDYSIEAIKYLEETDPGFYRIQKNYTSSPAIYHYGYNDAQAQGFMGTKSYQSHNQINYIKFLIDAEVIPPQDVTSAKWAPGFKDRPLLRNVGSVKYILEKKAKGFKDPGFSKIAEVQDIEIFKYDEFLPFGYTYDSYFTYDDFLALQRGQKDIALMKGIIVFDDDVPRFSGLKKIDPSKIAPKQYTYTKLDKDTEVRSQGALAMSIFKHDYLKGSVKLDKEKLVFFSIPYDSGWSAKVDGETMDVLQVNIGFIGLLLPAGEHTIELTYRPFGMWWFVLISLLGLLIYSFLIFRKLRNRNNLLSKT